MDYDRINENIKYNIDREKYFENYMEIRKTCLLRGFAPPQYLDILNLEIPVEYYNENDEENDFEYLLSDDAREKLEEIYKSRRKEDVRIMRMPSDFERESRLIEIYNRELTEFFERFPQFRIILAED